MHWVIGDLHGCLEQFDSVLSQIKERDGNPQIYCVGDYCDRGPNTKGVVDRIISEGIKCVRGNHDDVFDCILSGKPTDLSDSQHKDAALENLDWFLHFGMYETLASYGIQKVDVRAGLNSLEALKRMVNRIPESHIKFFNELPVMIQEDDFFVCHAACVVDAQLEDLLAYRDYRKAMIWGRYSLEDIKEEKAWGKTGYFGHTPTDYYGSKSPVFGPNIVLMDTGCVFDNCLSAICHETQEVLRSK